MGTLALELVRHQIAQSLGLGQGGRSSLGVRRDQARRTLRVAPGRAQAQLPTDPFGVGGQGH